jgi:hypothetical protein
MPYYFTKITDGKSFHCLNERDYGKLRTVQFLIHSIQIGIIKFKADNGAWHKWAENL